MKKILAIVLAALMVLSMVGCGSNGAKKEEDVKSEGVMTYAEFEAAELDTEVVIEAYVQTMAYNAEYGNANIFLQDHTGGYYVYRMNMTDAEAAQIKEGTKLQIKGFKSEWSGEVELTDATFTIMEGSYIADPVDVKSIYNKDDELVKYLNQKILLKDVEVAATELDGQEYAVTYSWDNSGEPGQNCDLYFSVLVDGIYQAMVLESDEFPEGSDVYTAVANLQVGDKIDLVASLYWYYFAQSHVISVTVK